MVGRVVRKAHIGWHLSSSLGGWCLCGKASMRNSGVAGRALYRARSRASSRVATPTPAGGQVAAPSSADRTGSFTLWRGSATLTPLTSCLQGNSFSWWDSDVLLELM